MRTIKEMNSSHSYPTLHRQANIIGATSKDQIETKQIRQRLANGDHGAALL